MPPLGGQGGTDLGPEARRLVPDRRQFLKLIGATATLAGTAGCDLLQPPEEIVGYVDQPEYRVPGEPRFFATASLLGGYALPVVGETHEARPTRVEGNDRHPDGGSGANLFAQAAVADLYDPERSRTVLENGSIATWPEAEAALRRRIEGHAADGGAGVALLTGAITSPTLARLIGEMRKRYPEVRWYRHEPWGRDRVFAATRRSFGDPFDLRPDLAGADAVVAVDADPLGPGPAQLPHARAWARRRAEGRKGGSWQKLAVAEPSPTLTGARADKRVAVDAARVPDLLAAIARRLGLDAGANASLPPALDAWAGTAATALRGGGPKSLLLAGAHQTVEAQQLALAINRKTGALGATLRLARLAESLPGDGRDLAALARDVAAGTVRTLVVLEVDAVHTAPADVDATAMLKGVPWSLHLGLYRDATARLCRWHVPAAHVFESWGDARTSAGTATPIQPLVRPLFGGCQPSELLAIINGRAGERPLDTVKATWRERWGEKEFDPRWSRALRRGFIEGETAPDVPAPDGDLPVPKVAEAEPPRLTADIRADPTAWDGSTVNNPWLQELPRPLTKATWTNVAAIGEALAKERGLSTGDVVELRTDAGRVEAPVWVLPGQAERTVTLTLGYGRRIGDKPGFGYDAYRLRNAAHATVVPLTGMRRTGRRSHLAVDQPHTSMEGHDLLRSISRDEHRRGNRFEPPPDASLYPDWKYDEVAWGMAIDLDACIGCNNCVVACQTENNVPVVGRDQVALGRAMHWLRVDVYRTGTGGEPSYAFQPVPCMHCEKAPCEVGCPVNATVHGPEGLNQMIYNRCVGTRTCAAYCPYKVRVFNYHDYAEKEDWRPPQRNPDVTVRTRGVMEKCTYCVQRIRDVRIAAEKEGRQIRDGEVVTACQVACPTQAIAFGNLRETGSEVAKAQASHRNYPLLGELGTRPRTTYLARIEAKRPGGKEG